MKIVKVFRAFHSMRTKCSSPFLCITKYASTLQSNANELLTEKPYISENEYAHKVVEKKFQYQEICSTPNTNVNQNFNEMLEGIKWNDLPTNEIVLRFEEISQHADIPISHPACLNLSTTLSRCASEMSDEQLILVLRSLKCWPLSESPRAEGFYELWNSIDNVCLMRWKKWKASTLFIFMEAWYQLHLTKKSTFVYKAATRLTESPHMLSKDQLVLLLFHLSIVRSATKNMPFYNIEQYLTEIAEELTIDELAVAVMGFFKAEKSLFNVKLMDTLINKLIQQMKHTEDIPFTAIIKILRKSLPTSLWPRAKELVDNITPEVGRLSLASCGHSALLTTKPQLLHKPLLDRVSQKLIDNISEARLKDMEKTVFPLAQLAYDPQTKPNIFQVILEELEKPERYNEIYAYPKSFIALIHYFCMKGVYSEKWIKKLLDIDFIHRTYGPKKYNFGRELLYIDCTVELECPEYDGPRLEHDIRGYLSKRYSEYLPDPSRKLSRHQAWHWDVKETAELLFGKEYMCQKYLLPHHPRADIVVHLDNEKSPLSMPESFMNGENWGSFEKAPGRNYVAIVTAGLNMYHFKSDLLNGESMAKLKQLKLIGYNTVVVPNSSWPKGSTIEKVNHLKDLIQSSGVEQREDSS